LNTLLEFKVLNPTSCCFGSWFACAQTAIFSAKP
jgi:hypothetical protein